MASVRPSKSVGIDRGLGDARTLLVQLQRVFALVAIALLVGACPSPPRGEVFCDADSMCDVASGDRCVEVSYVYIHDTQQDLAICASQMARVCRPLCCPTEMCGCVCPDGG
jgi:hypothetical protein